VWRSPDKTSGVAVCVGTAAANLPDELERPSLIVAGSYSRVDDSR